MAMVAGLGGCATAPQPAGAVEVKLGTVKETYESFKEAVTKEDYDAAYATLAQETKSRYPSSLFWMAFHMTGTGQHYRELISNSALVTSIEKSDGLHAVAVLRARWPEGGVEMHSFRLSKEGGNWLVQFTLQEFFGIPEEQFFDYTKVTAKRDFRHRR